MMFESGTLDGKGRMEDLVVKKIPEFVLHFTPQYIFEYEVSTNNLCPSLNRIIQVLISLEFHTII